MQQIIDRLRESQHSMYMLLNNIDSTLLLSAEINRMIQKEDYEQIIQLNDLIEFQLKKALSIIDNELK